MAARVLVIEDSAPIREAVAAGLRTAGHTVELRPDGRGVEEVVRAFRPDVVVLDLMLPGRDGFALLEILRSGGDLGVVILTARDSVPDRLRGLRSGADDYVVKPFDTAELVARVEAVLRRMGRVAATVEVDDLVIDQDAGVAVRAGSVLALTATEWRLLCYLVAQRGRVVSKLQIFTGVWGYQSLDVDLNLVEVHISALRRKLEQHGRRLVHTVRGRGYALRAEEP
ncbi:response regulator transcription factor [Saccharopolyspora erythraea]|uniref:response regulator transcription factor n=1 Tax=Saccharopolyspora erythraea TaxID=1836 RepID=UPI001BAE1E12|nr:response regulator transcription factor [Saccharopolyspora erythraea]QUH03868.1 response regulator transcription factor [Saccharopolyspora erythraea]